MGTKHIIATIAVARAALALLLVAAPLVAFLAMPAAANEVITISANRNTAVKVAKGKPLETYTQTNITDLARVFTGWDFDGYSGADIKYLADRAAVIPFLHAVAGKGEALITSDVIDEVLDSTPRSVAPEHVRRFEEWARTTQSV